MDRFLFHQISLVGGDVRSSTEGTLQLKRGCDLFLIWKQKDGKVVEAIEITHVERVFWKKVTQLEPLHFKVVVEKKTPRSDEIQVFEFSGFNKNKHEKFIKYLRDCCGVICQEELEPQQPDAEEVRVVNE